MQIIRRTKGFTLIEILVALTIIGVLLTFVAPYIFDRPDQARQLKIKSDFLAISTALNLYKLDNGTFPTVETGIEILSDATGSGKNYLSETPVDPWGTPYILKESQNSTGLIVVSAGADKTFSNGSEGDDISSDVIR